MKKFLFFILLFCNLVTSAQISLTGATYSQNFNNLGTTTGAVTGGSLNNRDASLNGWYFVESGSGSNTTITAGTGSAATGDTYNLGTSGGADRSLGGLQSGSNIPTIGFYFTNNTGATITSLTISYFGETWRVGTINRSDRLDFQYSTDATSLTTGNWIDFDNLDYANPGQSTLGTTGGTILHSATISNTITGLTIANGATFFIRWNDFSATGADDAIGVDDFSLTATLTYFPLTGATDLSQTNNWTGDINGGAGTAPVNFSSANQLFNINRNATLAGSLTFSGGSNLEINLATLTISPAGRLTIGTGSTGDFNGNSVVLQSDATGTASIGQISGTLSDASNVTVERFIPANTNRAWRLLSVPTTGSQTIAASWKANTWITTSNAIDDADAISKGFDAKTPGHSMQYFTGSGLAGVALGTDVLSAQPAYFLFVRGNRTSDHTNATVTSTTLSSTGTINQGSITRGTAGTGGTNFSLIPNPYPSNIDYEAVFAGNGSATALENFYVWDASINTVGGYRLVSRVNGTTYQQTPSVSVAADNNARYIQSGQAFWIVTPQQLNFTESMKTANVPTNNVFRMSNGGEDISINLSIKQAPSTYILADGVRAKYDVSYNAAVTSEDVAKLTNFGENLSIVRNNSYLAIEKRPVISAYDTIFLKLWNTGVKEYRFTVNPNNFSAGLNAYLEDAYLNTSTPISLTAATDVDFAITTDAGSQHIDRFRIVFRPSAVMPVSFTSVRAYEKGNAIEIAWNVAGERDIHHYEVEKSADGRNFTMLASVKAKGNENSSVAYTSLDNSPITGNNYYRVKSVSLNNEVKYTSVVNVRLGKDGEGISVYPNPVKGNVVGLQLTNLEKGSYTLNVYNSSGQLVVTKMLQHGGGSASEQIALPASSTKGVYQLEVRGEQSRFVQSIILQ